MSDGAPPITADAAVVDETLECWTIDLAPKELGRKTAHGALVSVSAQVCTLVLRTGSLALLARLLVKEDFGLVNMATTLTGFLTLFRDAGLSMATVQRSSITKAQTSTLFWLSLGLGGILAVLVAAAAPLLAAFYQQPRLFWVTVALGSTFLLNGAAAQHRALLQRTMRFGTIAIIDTGGIIVSIIVGVTLAWNGCRYWALVAMNIAPLATSLPAVWLLTGWTPTRPEWRSGVKQMVAYGGAITANNIIAYFAYNLDKVLVGRFCGAAALGIYGRAYQLITLPNDTIYNTVGSVIFPALSRVQNDAVSPEIFLSQNIWPLPGRGSAGHHGLCSIW